MNVCVHLLIRGRVQGVWYRRSAQETALSLGLSGWVRNLPGGEVEALVEGEEEKVEVMIAWCRRGPERARVEAVEVERRAPADLPHPFEMRPTP